MAVLEERGEGVLLDAIALVLLRVDRDALLDERVRPPEVAELGDELRDDLGCMHEHLAQGLCIVRRLVDLVEHDPVHGRVDQVKDVVEPADELVDILALEGRDEGRIELLDRRMGDLVPGVLDVLDLPGLLRDVAEILQQVLQGEGPVVDILRRLLEEVEKNLLFWDEAEHAAGN